mgnify:CR=1 FL=1
MGISVYQYTRDGLLKRAMAKADEIVHAWVESEKRDLPQIESVVCHWTWVTLRERIAYELMVAAGYPQDVLDDACDGNAPTGSTLGDLDAAMEKGRHPVPLDDLFPHLLPLITSEGP